MNERIKELEAKAREKKFDYISREGESLHNYVLNVEKFAELIVKECIDQCVHTNHNNQWDKGIAWAVGQIKEHFGIK